MCQAVRAGEIPVVNKDVPVSFEEALTKTGFGLYNYALLLLCGLMMNAMVFESFAISILIPASACELKTTPTQQGLMAAMPLLGIITCSQMWGYLADTRGRKKIIVVSLSLGGIAGLISTFSPNWIVLSIFKFISSSAVAGTMALSFTLLSEFTPVNKHNIMLLLATSIFFISQGLMAVLAIPILPLDFSYYVGFLGIELNSWRLLTVVYALPCLICANITACISESPKYLYSRGQHAEALKILSSMFARNTGLRPEDYTVKSLIIEQTDGGSAPGARTMWSSIKHQTVPLFKPPLIRNTIVVALLYVSVYVTITPYLTWLPSMANSFMEAVERGDTGLNFCQMLESTKNHTQHQTAIQPGIQSCALNVSAMVMVFLLGLIFATVNTCISGVVGRLGRKNLLMIIPIASAVSGLCLNFVTHSGLTIPFFIVFMCTCLSMGLLTAYTVDIYPTYLRAMAVCVTLMAGRGSAVGGINILKYLLEYNCEASFYVFSCITLVGAFVAMFLPSDKKN